MTIKPQRIVNAFQFLTILPLSAESVDEKEVGGSSAYFPLVGLAQGVLLLLASVLLRNYFSPDVLSAVLISILTISNGGFHLDGLSDTADALASGKDRERQLEIMKDSTIGPAGVVTIVLVLLLEYAALKTLLEHSLLFAVLFPVAGRWAMVPALYRGTSARTAGLGKVFIENTGRDELIISSVLATIITIAIFALDFGRINVFLILKALIVLSIIYVLSFLATGFFQRKFGGLTGDMLGAINELGEVVSLLVLLAVV